MGWSCLRCGGVEDNRLESSDPVPGASLFEKLDALRGVRDVLAKLISLPTVELSKETWSSSWRSSTSAPSY